MDAMTITEALAEMKTIGKRLEKKKKFVVDYLMRPEQVRDPLEANGGTTKVIRAERQSIADLCDRTVAIRRAIQLANEANSITVEGQTRTIADWLVWRREVAPWLQGMLGEIRGHIDRQRATMLRNGLSVVNEVQQAKPGDVVVNVNELDLAKEIETLETILGALDGQLSLKNATVTIQL